MRRAGAALGGLLLALVLLPAVAGAQSVEPPPPTPVPVPPSGSPSPSPFPTILRTPPPSAERPEIRAAAALLADLETGQVLLAKDPDRRLPVASLTKIMTALLALERTDPSDVVTVGEEAAAPSRFLGLSELGLRPGEQITVKELLYALLLQSANDAALALAEHVSGSVDAFVAAMNARGRRLGLANTRFYSPNGLDDRGYSTARDLSTLTRQAYRHSLFAQIVRTRFHDVPSPSGQDRHIQNRNVLLWLYPGALGVKTGFTTAAGFNVVAAAEREGRRLLAVVLGERGEAFSDAAALLNYGFEGFEERALVKAGEPFGTVPIQGRPVAVVSGGDLAGLVPEKAEPVRRVEVQPGVTFPPAAGERVGTVFVSVPGHGLGRVPLVVAGVPPPPPPPPGPWWRRAVSAVAHAVVSVLHTLLA